MLADADNGMHLCHAMLRPKMEAIERMPEFMKIGVIDFGPARVERKGKTAILTIQNPRFLNAEDDDTLADTETAADIAIFDPMSEICVLRGGVVEHPKYAGRKCSAAASISHISTAARSPTSGTSAATWAWSTRCCAVSPWAARSPDEVYGGTREKPWVAQLDVFAIGGGCQYLLAMDYVVAG